LAQFILGIIMLTPLNTPLGVICGANYLTG